MRGCRYGTLVRKSSRQLHEVWRLALMYWGAVLMWLVDGMYRLLDGEAFIEIADAAVMFDDAMLGLLVAIIGLAAWTVYLVIKGPKHVLRKTTTHVS